MVDTVQTLNIETMTSQLAREIARDLVPLDEIQKRYKIDEDTYQSIISSGFFKVRLEEELELWNASTPKAINERTSAKLATMIEESIPEVFELIHDKKQPMSAKIDALKWASAGSGLIRKEQASGGPTLGERVRFNIYIGDKQVSFEKPIDDAPPIEGSAVLIDKQPV